MSHATVTPRAMVAALALAVLTACSTDAPVAPRLDTPNAAATPASSGKRGAYTPVDLGLLPGDNFASAAWALNDRGQVVGRSWHIAGPGVEIGRAFRWTPHAPNAMGGVMVALAMPFGIPASSDAVAINEAGVAVGWVVGPFGQSAVMWMSDVGTPLPGLKAVAINNRGAVVLQAGTEASLWVPGRKGSDAGHVHPLGSFFAEAINDRGQIVGSKPGVGAVLWQPNEAGGVTGELVPLGTLGGGTTSAIDINDRGAIVGYATGGTADVALLWEPTRPYAATFTVTNLDPVIGATSATASGINDKGAITGLGRFPSYEGAQLWIWEPSKKHGSPGTLKILGSGRPPDVGLSRIGPAINNRGDVAYVLNVHATLWLKN